MSVYKRAHVSAGHEITIDASELAEWVDGWTNLTLGPALKVLGEELVEGVKEEFDTGGHGEWQALAPSTIRKKLGKVAGAKTPMGADVRKLLAEYGDDDAQAVTRTGTGQQWAELGESVVVGPVGSLLVETGMMKGSVRHEEGEDWTEAATHVAYAVYHVSNRPRTKIPLRDFFAIPDARLNEAVDVFLTELVRTNGQQKVAIG